MEGRRGPQNKYLFRSGKGRGKGAVIKQQQQQQQQLHQGKLAKQVRLAKNRGYNRKAGALRMGGKMAAVGKTGKAPVVPQQQQQQPMMNPLVSKQQVQRQQVLFQPASPGAAGATGGAKASVPIAKAGAGQIAAPSAPAASVLQGQQQQQGPQPVVSAGALKPVLQQQQQPLLANAGKGTIVSAAKHPLVGGHLAASHPHQQQALAKGAASALQEQLAAPAAVMPGAAGKAVVPNTREVAGAVAALGLGGGSTVAPPMKKTAAGGNGLWTIHVLEMKLRGNYKQSEFFCSFLYWKSSLI